MDLKTRLSKAWNALRVKPADPNEDSSVRLFGGTATYSGVRVDHEIAMRVSAVWACIDVIASALASSDWNVYGGQRGADTKEALPDDGVQRLLNSRFNAEMTAQAGKRALMIAAVGYGNGYAEIERDGAGRPMALWPIEPDRVQPMRERGTGQLFYRCTQDTEAGTVDLMPEEVFHIRGASLIGIAGDDMLNRAVQSIAQAVAMDQFSAGFFGNNAQLGTVFMYKGGKLDDAHYDRLRQQMEEKHKGARKAFRSAILDGGDWDVKTIGSDIAQSQLIAAKQLSVEEICRWFRVPPHKVAHLLRATNNNIEHQGLEFSRDTLRPWRMEIEQEADYKLFSRRSQRFVEIDLDWAEQGDYKSRADAYSVLRNIGVFSANDILRKLGENTIGPDGDIRVVQGANVKLEDVGAAYAQPAQSAPSEPENEPEPEMAEAWLRSTFARIEARVKNRKEQNKSQDGQRKAELDGFSYIDEATRDLMPVFCSSWPEAKKLIELRAVRVVRGMDPADAAADCMAILTGSTNGELRLIRNSIKELKDSLPTENKVEVNNHIEQPTVMVEGAVINIPDRQVNVQVDAPHLTVGAPVVNLSTPEREIRVQVDAPVVNVSPVVNVPEQPVTVNIETPAVTVNQPDVHVQVDAPVVNIPDRPVTVNVEAPAVTVNQPDVNVHVDAPIVNVTESPVNVSIPETVVNVNVPEQRQEAPIVNVAAPVVNIEPAKVQVNAHMPAPEVTVNLPDRESETTIERDGMGRIVRSITHERDTE